MRSQKLLRDLKEHTKTIRSLSFHSEELLLASSAADRTIRFWDLGTFEQCDMTAPVAKEVCALAFPTGGQALLAASSDGLRTFSWEPSMNHDFVDAPWNKVRYSLNFLSCRETLSRKY